MLIFQGVSMRRWCMIPIIEMNVATQLCISYVFIILYHLHSSKITFSHLIIGRCPKGNYIVFQPSIFRCELLVSGRVEKMLLLLESIIHASEKQINQNCLRTWNAKCPICLGNFTPKTSNYCLKNRAPTAFQEPFFGWSFFFLSRFFFWKPRQSGYRVLKTESSLIDSKKLTFFCVFFGWLLPWKLTCPLKINGWRCIPYWNFITF